MSNPPKDVKALIVAAGLGLRLRPLTQDRSKALLDVGGLPLLLRSIEILNSYGIKDITVVVGYQQESIRRMLGASADYVVNADYANTNNMVSMSLGRAAMLGHPFIYLHSDLWYHPEIIGLAMKHSGGICFLVEEKPCGEEEMKVRVHDGLITEADKSIPSAEAYGEWLGITKFEPEGASVFFDEVDRAVARTRTLYDCAVVRDLAARGTEIRCVSTGALPWVEIDFPEDLEYARVLAEREIR